MTSCLAIGIMSNTINSWCCWSIMGTETVSLSTPGSCDPSTAVNSTGCAFLRVLIPSRSTAVGLMKFPLAPESSIAMVLWPLILTGSDIKPVFFRGGTLMLLCSLGPFLSQGRSSFPICFLIAITSGVHCSAFSTQPLLADFLAVV